MSAIVDLLRDNPFTTFLGAIVTALSGYLVARRNTAPSVQESLNTGVGQLVEHYTRALEQARAELAGLKVEMEGLKRLIVDLGRTVESQSDHIETLQAHIDVLTQAMTQAGLTPPARIPYRPGRVAGARAQAAAAVASVEETLDNGAADL